MAGCSTIQPQGFVGQGESQPAAAAPDLTRGKELADIAARRARSLDTMQTSAVMEYSGGGKHVKTREDITVKRPGNLRVEALNPFGVSAIVAANGNQIAVYVPSQNVIYRGQASAATLNRFAQIPLDPKPATDLLLGLAPDDIANSTPESVRNENGETVVRFKSSDGSVSELGFDGDRLASVRSITPNGQVRYEVRYSDFRDIGGVMLAHVLQADFPGSGSSVKFQYQRPIVNGNISASTFSLSPGTATREVNIDHAPETSSPTSS